MPLATDHRDGPRDECGVFGIYAPEHDVARLAYFALFALQHRGQESAGIATAARGGNIMAIRDQGLVAQVFDEHTLSSLLGDMAIGHVRYSTTGSSEWQNAQPVVRDDSRALALAHNGNLINALELYGELRGQDVPFRSTSDSELIAALLARHDADKIEDAVADVVPRLQGAFSTVVMTEEAVVAFRDPHGLRPLALGMIEEEGRRPSYCVASESCAFDLIGAQFLREVQPGEMITLTEGGFRSRMIAERQRHAMCVFEYIYFARPDSRLGGTVLQVARARMGEILWREAPVEADLVIAVPDSGNAAARGLARAAGLPQDDGFIKNRYVARTFIQPGQELRRHGVRLKFNPLPEVVAGKRLVVVDDSIVRGNTTRQIMQMLRDAGAREIHLRISAPPIKHPCHYGIDMPTREEMIAHRRTVPQVAAELGVDSLHYLSLEGVYEAIGGSRANHCDACFSGEYPLPGTEQSAGKHALEAAPPLARV
jgi:amidophosphoribosyltransferase